LLSATAWGAAAATLTYQAKGGAASSFNEIGWDWEGNLVSFWIDDYNPSYLPLFDASLGRLEAVVFDATLGMHTVGDFLTGGYSASLGLTSSPYTGLVEMSGDIDQPGFSKETTKNVTLTGAEVAPFLSSGPGQSFGISPHMAEGSGYLYVAGEGFGGAADIFATFDVKVNYVYTPFAQAAVLSAPVPPAIASMAFVPLVLGALGLRRRRAPRKA
jgi:MYXO-CTERM domain-containing protein